MSRALTAIRTLDVPTIEALIERARQHREHLNSGASKPEGGKRIGLLFFEGSTRTRVSFEQAAHYLGHTCVNFASQGSSMAKGETFRDTILTLKHERLDAMVIRHPASGSAALAQQFFEGPVINAGDGKHEHPTQALGDALTIADHFGTLQGLTIAIVGDVAHSRVARSNAFLLSMLGNEVRFVGPRTLMPGHPARLPGHIYYDLNPGIRGADVVMCLRLQRERMDDGLLTSVNEFRRMYQINGNTLRYANKDAIVMHPGPMNRGVEIDDLTADGSASHILNQVENCIFARMAALDYVFSGESA
ncbi:MAG: aspartate carbamoyltransferase catalytic subunit [Chthonomonas sp.]|nr:aspartate carbamoyltransferase catalytic subunit [Chthonomonas sp.]